MIPANFTLFAAPADDEGVTEAKAWVAAQGFTKDDVKIIKRESQCLVISLRPVSPKTLS